MDINSLLSPQDTPPAKPAVNSAPQNQPAPTNQSVSPLRRPTRPGSGKRTASSLSQEITLHSPPHDPPRSMPNLGFDRISQAQQSAFQPVYNGSPEVHTPQSFSNTPASESRSPFSTPQLHRPSLQYATSRTASNSQPESLNDATAVQHSQISRHNSYSDPLRSPSGPSAAGRVGINRSISAISSSDIVMAEAPAQTPPPRVVTVPSLSDADQKTVNDLESYLAENSYAYDSHVQLINLLHQGFVAHVYDASGHALHDPREYNLLSDLRQARDAMDSRFAVGEDLWKDWIQDESLLARSGEERMSVMELCHKAVQEEPLSVSLWLLYGEWVMQTFSVANGQAEGDPAQWTDEDKIICREVFTREYVLDVWERAVQATQWRLDESHRIWDRYIDWILQEFPENPTPNQIEQVSNMFMMRLQVPHSTWSETSSKFWPIVSRHNAENWEEIMAATNEMAGPAKQQYGLRELHEHSVRRASESGDKTLLYTVYNDYLNWEVKNERKGRRADFTFELRCALYERALLCFPTVIDWWLDYTDYLIKTKKDSPTILPVLERATRHCPWSGDLWSRRIIRCEVEKLPYEEVGNVKHKATNSGLLNIGGMEEVLKVYSAWCSYLRRRAFDPDNTDDEVDMAEMGITGTLEDAQVAGKKIYGQDFQGDPLFRLEKIHIKFLTQARRTEDARGVWQRLVATQSQNSDFWLRYYNWAMYQWAYGRQSQDFTLETPENAPHEATAIIRQALAQKNLDWPEKVIDAYAHHFHLHELVDAVQYAEVEVRKARYHLQKRRAKEAEEAAAAAADAAAAQIQENVAEEQASQDASLSTKRKRDDESQQNGDDDAKRNKTGATQPPFQESSSSTSAQIKRDREHNTITVKNLPKDVTERRVRQFFADCGKILSVAIISEDDSMVASATIEFSDHEGVLAAKTRDMKDVDGQTIKIHSGTLSTLYVTNYPSDYDEAKMRELFQDFGTIVSIRFPSLKYNQRRRFCYVQFLTTEEARAATVLNNKAIDGQHSLTVLISDPDAKKSRSGATSEGRELHVGNVEHDATEKEIHEFFAQHGKVERVRMIRGTNGKFTGTCFVIFSQASEASDALVLNNKPLRSRLLRVSLATDKSSAQKLGLTKIIRGPGESAEPEDGHSGADPVAAGGRRGSVMSNPSHAGEGDAGLGEETARTRRQRTVALLNLPDTVNDARVESVLSAHGPLRKLTIRRDKGGALAEFVNLQDAGKVGLGIDCSALGPQVRVGDAAELLGHVRSAHTKKPGPSQGTVASSGSATALPLMRPAQATVSRPGQRGGGRRGGLGFKRGGFGSGGANRPSEGGEGAGEANKGNADFRALFEKSREAKAEGNATNGAGDA